MGAFGGLILTKSGLALQSKVQLGTTLHFTRIAMGDGSLTGQSIVDLKTMISEKKSLPITKAEKLPSNQAVVGAVLNNQDISTGFYFREIGVFAQNPDGGSEILYCYANAGKDAEYIPAAGGADILERYINAIVIVGNTANISATIDQSLIYLTMQDFNQHVNDKAAHGATPAATANAIVRRDDAGRFKASAPAASDDVTRKAEVDAVQTNLTNHTNAGTVHGSTPSATPNAIAQRDANGRLKAAAPAASDDVARKAEVDDIRSDATKPFRVEVRTTDPVNPEPGQVWCREDLLL
ncbi:phage tail-collar fiber domain-containing protein [Paenibacillus sp. UNC451MF]|uniref:phage tail-collar fiber domain-containing protein n=1 Tax=Paenibacillus sp. UNC451MF TaxID=1449063 RepID=UPI0004910E73|nr:phage tail protein [Paenibacillus sp. UNC451MF]